MREWSCFGKATPVVVVLAAFQFWHWFRPSEPFLVDILKADLHVPEAVVYHDIYPWSTYALLPATLLSAALFEVFGFGSALLLAALGDVVTVFLVILSRGELGPLWASQVTFALSFAAVFSVVATLFALLPPDLYQKASSYSRAASLVGTIASSLVGQALASFGLRWWTLWGTVAGTTVSLVVIGVALWLGVLRPFGHVADLAETLLPTEPDDGLTSHAANDTPLHGSKGLVAHSDHGNGTSTAASPDHSIRDLDRSLHMPRAAAAASPQPAISHPAQAVPSDAMQLLVPSRGPHRSDTVDTSDDVASVASSEGSSLWGINPSEATPSRIITRLRKVLSSAWVSYSSPVVLGLSLWSAVLRAAHTLALTYWQPLLDELRPEQDGSGNGIIYAVAYICAAAATCAPALLESDVVARLCGCTQPSQTGCCRGQQWGLVLLASGSLVAAGALTVMATATSVTLAAAALIVFHSTGELLLVVAAAAIGREMVRQEARRTGIIDTAKLVGSLPLVQSERVASQGDLLSTSHIVGEIQSPLLGTKIHSASDQSTDPHNGPGRAAKGVYFAAVLGINALVGMVLQLIVQASVGTGPNRLGLAWQYAVFAGVVVVGMVLGVMVPAITACFGAGRPKPNTLR